MVMFEPWVDPHDHHVKQAYDYTGLISMIDKISSRFSKVVLREASAFKYIDRNSETLIASAAAKWNKNKTANTPPMEVVLTCSLDLPGNKTEPTSFDIAKTLADHANSIYPETVKTILVVYDNLNMTNIEKATEQLSYAKNMTSEDTFKYKLGMILPIIDCGNSLLHLQTFLTPVLPYMDVVYFEKTPSIEEVEAGVESSFPLIFKQFERCLQKVHKVRKEISIGFRTDWPDSKNSSVQNMSALVDYWQRANQWATAVNASVVMWDAFDTYYRGNAVDQTQGWWRLDTTRSYKDQTEFVFLEKSELIRSSLPPDDSKPDVPGLGWDLLTVLCIAVVPFSLLLMFITLAVFLVYKKIMRNVEVKCLPMAEINQFFQGGTSPTTEGTLSNIYSEPYNKNLELSKDSFTIDETSVLGMGTFGAVFRAVVRPTKDEEKQAAVKIPMASSPSSALRSFLYEIKILSHVGHHENIVGVIGAYTQEISKGHVYVFFELCSNGSLESYLRKSNSKLETTENAKVEDGAVVEQKNTFELAKQKETDMMPLPQLKKWSYEIARGMEFLAGKHVVHSDLATRNVLLTENKTAKISDFGLSRRMYDYTNYLKSQQEPLPWRWMAPESLRRLEFGEKTDVWAYGITLWEIFTFGDIPYPGLTWTTDYLKRLEEGLRPDRPTYATQEIFEIMEQCWKGLSSKRPKFSELRQMLTIKLEDNCQTDRDHYEQV